MSLLYYYHHYIINGDILVLFFVKSFPLLHVSVKVLYDNIINIFINIPIKINNIEYKLLFLKIIFIIGNSKNLSNL